MRNELRFSSIKEIAVREGRAFLTFSLTFRLERDISESPYFMHLIYYEHLERRNGMQHYSTCVRVAFVFAAFLLLSTGSVWAQTAPAASGSATFTVTAVGK